MHDAKYYPIVKITLNESVSKHDAILREQHLLDLLSQWLKDNGIDATADAMR